MVQTTRLFSRSMGRWLMALMLVMLSSLATRAVEAYACYTSSNTTLTFYYDNLRSSRTGTTYDLNTGTNNPGWVADNTNQNVTMVKFDNSFKNYRPTTTYKWFFDMQNLASISALSNLNTSEVTMMKYMFSHCNALYNLNLTSFNTANVTNMTGMFQYCSGLSSLDLRNFNTENVTNMSDMFYECSNLQQLDLSSFNTANVTNMSSMFNFCTSLKTLDLSSFNTANVTDMSTMFFYCSNLTTIYVGPEWSTAAVNWPYSNSMFYNCTKLVGGMGTTYDEFYVDDDYAHIDGGPSNPGYFSEKPSFIRGDVNGDGQVKINDVTALINFLLSHNGTGINLHAADANQSGGINISDVTALINFLLSHNWSN